MIRKATLALSGLLCAAALAANPAPAEAQRNITCQSTDYDRTYCEADTRGGVRMVRQLSQTTCQSGRTWGADRRGIWVSGGCRAEFVVGGGGVGEDTRGRVNAGRESIWSRRGDNRSVVAERNRAERVCRQAVRERVRTNRNGGINVAYSNTARDGDYLVRWSTNRDSGTCRVNRGGGLERFNVSRR